MGFQTFWKEVSVRTEINMDLSNKISCMYVCIYLFMRASAKICMHDKYCHFYLIKHVSPLVKHQIIQII